MTLTTDLRATPRFEWPTWALLVLSYATWAYATAGSLPIWAAICAVAFAAALHSSLSHEALHGHPTPWAGINEALVTPALTFCVPYRRFRDTHLAHHQDERLTDPYDDPETNFMDPDVWARLPKAWQLVLRFNNTLFGRLLIGPALGIGVFLLGDFRLIRAGNREVRAAWLWHIPGIFVVVTWLFFFGNLPAWAVIAGTYGAWALLRIRTFLEHRAHDRAAARTVIVEDRGLLALIFLNNNFHAVHHSHPCVPWYRLPGLYAARKSEYLRKNGAYSYAGYGEVFRRYFFSAKDPVPHPLWRRR